MKKGPRTKTQPVDGQVVTPSELGPANEPRRRAVVDKATQYWKESGRRCGGAGGGAGRQKVTANVPKTGTTSGANGDYRSVARPSEMSQVQKKLIGRRKEGVNRGEARQILLHQLIWRENESTNKFHEKRWCVLVASEETDGFAPEEIWCQAFENDVMVARMAFLVKKEKSAGSGSSEGTFTEAPVSNATESEKLKKSIETQMVYWLPENISDLNAVCLAIYKFCANCWNNMILVPASQLTHFIDFFHWLKDSRDLHYKRDTQSIRLDRFMCIEDVIQVFRDYNKHEGKGIESLEWERTITNNSAPIKARDLIQVACDYTRNALRSACKPPISQTLFINQMNQQRNNFANPFMRALQPEPELSFGFDDGRSPEEQAETLELVRSWLSKRCPDDADHEDMEPYRTEI
ncbi:unnamed protein product, partial [Mesorhabditis belari]|uniref:Uncharacterized protein n=1 Tax=Mesorhabditis belari TaxID=2138241 RepID=A0AAF3EU29_9BILA